MTIADEIMAYLRASIAERGGSGRRLSKIKWDADLSDRSDDALRAGIQELVESGRCRLESPPGFPMWVYLIPNESEDDK